MIATTSLEIPGYTLEQLLGQGAFGEVYQALWNGDFPCAVKVMQEGALHLEYLGSMLERLMELPPHEGMLPIYAFDLESEQPHVSMALMPDGSATFESLAGQLPQREAWLLLRQLADCLAWLHSYGLVHAGLTGRNVFVVEVEGAPAALLSDPGQAWLGSHAIDLLHRQAPYFPPERWLEPNRLLVDGGMKTWDVYAFGVLAWRFLNGTWPRAGRLLDQMITARGDPFSVDAPALLEWLKLESSPRWPDTVRAAAERAAVDVLLRCLALDPSKRPASMIEVARILNGLDAADTISTPTVGNEVQPVADRGWEPPPSMERKNPPEALLNGVNGAAAPEAESLPFRGSDLLFQNGFPSEKILHAEEMPREASSEEPVESVLSHQTPAQSDQPVGIRVSPPEGLNFSDPEEPNFLTGEERRQPLFSSVFAQITKYPPDVDGAVVFELPDEPGEPLITRKNLPQLVPDDTEWHLRYRRVGMSRLAPILRSLAMIVSIAAGICGIIYGARQQAKTSQIVSKAGQAGLELAQAQQAAAEASTKAKALEQARVADGIANLAANRTEWVKLVADLLKSKPAETTELEAWKLLASPMADRLAAALSAADAEPSLVASGIIARWHLGGLYAALDRPDEALPYLGKGAGDLEMEAAGGIEPDDAKRLLANRFSALRGAILFEQRKTAEAIPLLIAASKGFEAWIAAYPDRNDIAREFAANSLQEGRALMERGQSNEGSIALDRVAVLLGVPGSPGFELPDHLVLSDSLAALARHYKSGGKAKEAMEHYMDAISPLIPYDREYPKSVPGRNRLGDHYFELGVLLTKSGHYDDALIALNEALKVLRILNDESVPGAKLRLAFTYHEVAELFRASRPNAAGAKTALPHQDFSLELLRALNETNTLDSSLRRHLASALVLNGELQEMAGNPKESLSRFTEAVAFLNDLIADAELADSEKLECRCLLARAWTGTGSIHEKSGRKPEAITSLGKAIDSWAGLPAGDPVVARNLASNRERLSKLKPGG